MRKSVKIFIGLDVEGVDEDTVGQFESLVEGAIAKEVKLLKKNYPDAAVKTETSRIGKFTFYWRGGNREVLDGFSPENALNAAGHGGGVVGALDFWAIGDCQDWIWSEEVKDWKMV